MVIFSLFLTLFPSFCSADMNILTDGELSGVFACGFSSFSIDGNTARAEFDILAWTHTDIDSFKLGYYNDGVSHGWDEDWTNVSMGSEAEDLVFNGVYMEAVFDNIGDPGTRQLKSVKFGTRELTGTISAEFNSFSGQIAAGSPVDGHRLTPVFTEITLDQSGAYISLEVEGDNKGFYIHFDNAVTN